MRILITLVVFCISCQPKKTETTPTDYLGLSYATTFDIISEDQEYMLINTEPWPKATEKREFAIKNPLKRVVCTSTSHLPYFEMLGSEDVVVGFPEAKYISSQVFLDRVESGQIVDLGNAQSMNMELLIALEPEAVIAFDSGGESNTLDKIEKLGIPVIYNSDFLEQTPLGRAEYIKFFGALVGKERKADSLFKEIEKRYEALVRVTRNLKEKPTILSGTTYGDTWFLPGGKNWAAIFFEDAGGNYLWKESEASGWLELSFEATYEKANDADYWIGLSTFETMDGLKGQDNRYTNFKAFQEGNVFNYHKIKGPNGGFDFFESGYSRPDLILSDLTKILHPELLPDYETVYFQQLP